MMGNVRIGSIDFYVWKVLVSRERELLCLSIWLRGVVSYPLGILLLILPFFFSKHLKWLLLTGKRDRGGQPPASQGSEGNPQNPLTHTSLFFIWYRAGKEKRHPHALWMVSSRHFLYSSFAFSSLSFLLSSLKVSL